MTNQMIIAAEQIRLLNEGKLGYTGRKLKVFNVATQQDEEIDEIQPLRTFAAWKSLGYKVKKGEKAIAKFPIWKFIVNAKTDGVEIDENGDIIGQGKMFMKTSAFFTDTQVEKMEVEK